MQQAKGRGVREGGHDELERSIRVEIVEFGAALIFVRNWE